jgi:hypothetical protein
VVTWGELAEVRPDLAVAGHELLYQFGVGLAFLATTAADGSPRVHPVCPLLTAEQLFVFVVPSPKRADLRRDGRLALHSFPAEDGEDACYVTGRAEEVGDQPLLRAELVEQFVAERAPFAAVDPASLDEQTLFRIEVERVLITRTTGHGDPAPRHEVWKA